MRLALRLTVVLVLGSAILLSAQAVLQARRLVALNEIELRDDLVILANALRASVGALWRQSGLASARDYVRRADARRARTHIRLVPAHTSGAATKRDLSAGALNPVVRDDRLLLRVRVPGPRAGQAPLTIEISRSLAGSRDWTRRVIWEQVLVASVVVVATGTLALVLGLYLVGRRVQRLIAQARQVGQGAHVRNEDRGRDELGALATELNHMVERLQQTEQQVAQALRARSVTLEQLRHADRLSTVGKLSSAVAHELGTPLNVVAGRAQMIVDGDEPRANATIIARQAEQMTQTIRQLLDFARKSPMGDEVCAVDDVMARAATLMEPLADGREAQIDITPSGGLEMVAESSRVLQVLTNLMVNGIQAMPKGGTLSMCAQADQVDDPPERRAAPGHYVRIDVRDQGIGIDPETLRHVFEPFFTTKKRQEGTGLGLSVCHDIVSEHGGWIQIESQPGQGSRFSVFWPARGAT